MHKAGTYRTRLIWLKGTRTKDDIGQDVLTREEYGSLWCSLEETNGKSETVHGARQTGADATIRVNGAPSLSVDDLLQDFDGLTYHIVSIFYGDRELVCDCYRYDSLEDFELSEGS